MKATGIVRRIDDLGRVVIPKEIRRTMRIREGDPLEIYTENDGEVIFKKYSPIGELSSFATQYTEVLSKSCGKPVIITDRDSIVASYGIPKKDVIDHRITDEIESFLEQRKIFTYDGAHKILAVNSIDRAVSVAAPVIASGDLSGAVIMLLEENATKPTESEIQLINVAAMFLAKQMEE